MAGDTDISDWPTIQLEARASGANQWRRDPGGQRWLYKVTRVAAATGELQGEDWAEKAVERLAPLLGVPCAQVELAVASAASGATRGVISCDLVRAGSELQNGANLLCLIEGYRNRDSKGRPPRNHIGHSVATVTGQLAVFDVAPPVGFTPPHFSAVDVFAGYLVLDAWVGNLDRHEENWAVLRDGGEGCPLPPRTTMARRWGRP